MIINRVFVGGGGGMILFEGGGGGGELWYFLNVSKGGLG